MPSLSPRLKGTWDPVRTQPKVGITATAITAVGGFCLLVAGWILLHRLYAFELTDIPVYQEYGDAVLDGLVPYWDFSLGYPPAAVPVFVLPAIGSPEHYRGIFEFLMLLCAEAAIGFAALTLRSVGADRMRLFGAAVFIGLAPVALGTVVLTRYDFWPAALTAAALAALVADRVALGGALLAVSVAAKLYAIVLLPLALLYVARRRGRRFALVPLAVFGITLALLTLPFAFGGGGLEGSAEAQTVERPLQVESLGGAALVAAHQMGVYRADIVGTAGVQALAGSLSERVAEVMTVLQIATVVLVWILFWRGVATRERLLLAAAAAVAGFVAFGRVLSPQYLIWLVPLVPLVPLVAGRLGVLASATLASSLVLTQVWFPSRYFDVVALEDITWVVLARDLVLVALFGLLTFALRPRRAAT
jgi:hypothetical protein